jgi:hypothetical protein
VNKHNRGPLDFCVGDRELIGPDLKVMPKDRSFEVVKDDSFLTLISIPPLGLSFLKCSREPVSGGGRLACTRWAVVPMSSASI